MTRGTRGDRRSGATGTRKRTCAPSRSSATPSRRRRGSGTRESQVQRRVECSARSALEVAERASCAPVFSEKTRRARRRPTDRTRTVNDSPGTTRTPRFALRTEPELGRWRALSSRWPRTAVRLNPSSSQRDAWQWPRGPLPSAWSNVGEGGLPPWYQRVEDATASANRRELEHRRVRGRPAEHDPALGTVARGLDERRKRPHVAASRPRPRRIVERSLTCWVALDALQEGHLATSRRGSPAARRAASLRHLARALGRLSAGRRHRRRRSLAGPPARVTLTDRGRARRKSEQQPAPGSSSRVLLPRRDVDPGLVGLPVVEHPAELPMQSTRRSSVLPADRTVSSIGGGADPGSANVKVTQSMPLALDDALHHDGRADGDRRRRRRAAAARRCRSALAAVVDRGVEIRVRRCTL
jgi:hypothetical protein